MKFSKRAVEALAGAVLLASVGCTNIHVYPSEDSYQAAESRAGRYRRVVIPAGGVLDGAVHLLADDQGRLYLTQEELRRYAASEGATGSAGGFAGGIPGPPLGRVEEKAESALTPGKGVEVSGAPLGPGEISRGSPTGPEKKQKYFKVPIRGGAPDPNDLYFLADSEGRLYLSREDLKRYAVSEGAEQSSPQGISPTGGAGFELGGGIGGQGSGIGGLPTKPGESGGLPTGPEKKYFRIRLPSNDPNDPWASPFERAVSDDPKVVLAYIWVDEKGNVVVPPEVLKQYGIEPQSGSEVKLPEIK